MISPQVYLGGIGGRYFLKNEAGLHIYSCIYEKISLNRQAMIG